MKVKNIIMMFAVLFISFTACVNQKETKTATDNADSTAIVVDKTPQTAIDWAGTYKGTVPCADCEGIETTITLKNDLTYEKVENYISEKKGNTFNTKGRFEWKDDGATIALISEDGTSSLYKVAEGTLTMLDADGNEATGETANLYILTKTL